LKILTDTHCHTLASDHAFSTAEENIAAAKRMGLELIAITDHAPSISDSPHDWHFPCMGFLPHNLDGVILLRGAEANIVDYNGTLDLSQGVLKHLDLVIASLHAPCIAPGTKEQNTNALLECMKNEYVNVLGHIGHPSFSVDYEAVVVAAKQYGKLIEMNNHAFLYSPEAAENFEQVARLCMKHGTPVVVSSDAHFSRMIGKFDGITEMLSRIEFPQELIQNTTAKKLLNYLNVKIESE
jgi:putative hydrolase